MMNHSQRINSISKVIESEMLLQNKLYSKASPDGEIYGLKYYKGLSKEIYYPESREFNIYCYVSKNKTEKYHPSCAVFTEYNKDFHLWYRFSKNYLASWKDINAKVREFISAMEKPKEITNRM